MARKKVLPASPPRDGSREDESLLLRSAESLGRMIGSLQRQLEVATGRLAVARKSAGTRTPAQAKSGGLKAQSGTAARGGARRKSASPTRGKTARRRTTKSAKKR